MKGQGWVSKCWWTKKLQLSVSEWGRRDVNGYPTCCALYQGLLTNLFQTHNTLYCYSLHPLMSNLVNACSLNRSRDESYAQWKYKKKSIIRDGQLKLHPGSFKQIGEYTIKNGSLCVWMGLNPRNSEPF